LQRSAQSFQLIRFSEREKTDRFRNLPPVDELLERVARMQRQSGGVNGFSTNGNGNGNED